LRGHYSTLNHDYIASPRINLILIPAWRKNIQFNTGIGIYYQPPFYKELRDLQGNIKTNTKAQRSIHYVFGGEYRFMAWNRPFIFSTEFYYKYITNLIPYKIEDVQIKYLTQWEKAKGYATGIDLRVYGEFVEGSESWVSISLMQTKEDIYNDYYQTQDGTVVYPGYYSRPTEQLLSFGLFFQDYLPSNPGYKLHLTLIFGTGLSYGSTNYNIPSQIYPLGSYERVDIGLSKALISEYKKSDRTGIFRHFRNIWLNVEVLNLLDKKNRASYDWVKTIENNITSYSIWSVPNYLTGRRFNLRITAEF
jgi:hypothetical protein